MDPRPHGRADPGVVERALRTPRPSVPLPLWLEEHRIIRLVPGQPMAHRRQGPHGLVLARSQPVEAAVRLSAAARERRSASGEGRGPGQRRPAGRPVGVASTRLGDAASRPPVDGCPVYAARRDGSLPGGAYHGRQSMFIRTIPAQVPQLSEGPGRPAVTCAVVETNEHARLQRPIRR